MTKIDFANGTRRYPTQQISQLLDTPDRTLYNNTLLPYNEIMDISLIRNKFNRLLRLGVLTELALDSLERESTATGTAVEELMIRQGIPKHEVLFCLSEYYGYPFVEFDESVAASYFLVLRLDLEHQKKAQWFPLSVRDKKAEVVTCCPDDKRMIEDIKNTLGVEEIDFRVAL